MKLSSLRYPTTNEYFCLERLHNAMYSNLKKRVPILGVVGRFF